MLFKERTMEYLSELKNTVAVLKKVKLEDLDLTTLTQDQKEMLEKACSG